MHPRIRTLLRKTADRSRIVRWVAACVITQRLRGVLERQGYIRSQLQGESVDRNGNPVPWLPYSVTAFLTFRVRKDVNVFEFGSGNSTLWWAQRAARVIAVEHDPSYFERMQPCMPDNVTYLCRNADAGDQYEDTILDYIGQIDIAVVDGRRRPQCLRTCVRAIRPNGVIILDNSDYEGLAPDIAALESDGFRRLAIEGLPSLQTWVNETSIFYRDDNILSI